MDWLLQAAVRQLKTVPLEPKVVVLLSDVRSLKVTPPLKVTTLHM